MKEQYKELLEKVESLQSKLMKIKNYDEDVYQAFESTIDTLNDYINSEQAKLVFQNNAEKHFDTNELALEYLFNMLKNDDIVHVTYYASGEILGTTYTKSI